MKCLSFDKVRISTNLKLTTTNVKNEEISFEKMATKMLSWGPFFGNFSKIHFSLLVWTQMHILSECNFLGCVMVFPKAGKAITNQGKETRTARHKWKQGLPRPNSNSSQSSRDTPNVSPLS